MADKSCLTRRQLEVLQLIDDFIFEHGYPPTLREIGTKLGIRSTNGTVSHLDSLTKKGYIRREKLSRSITLLKVVPRDTMTVEIRVTCSRCGIKLADERIIYQVRTGSLRHPKPAVDFCDSCHAAFQSWLSNGKSARTPEPLPGQGALFAEMVKEAKETF